MKKTQLDGTKKNELFVANAGYDTLITSSKANGTIILNGYSEPLSDLQINHIDELELSEVNITSVTRGKSIGTGKNDALYINFTEYDYNDEETESDNELDSRVIVEGYFNLDKDGNVIGTKSNIKNIYYSDYSYNESLDEEGYVLHKTNLIDFINMSDVNEDYSYKADSKGVVKGSVFGDTVTSTTADETFKLGTGSDTIKFKENFGDDTIIADGTSNTIDLSGYENLNLEFNKKGNDVEVVVSDDNNKYYGGTITVKNYLKGTKTAKSNVSIKTQGGVDSETTTLSLTDVLSGSGFLASGDAEAEKAQTVKGTVLDDVLLGGAGNDKLYGYDGNDVFVGGLGNDTINTGEGEDYILLAKENNDYSVDTVVRGVRYGSEQHIEFVETSDVWKENGSDNLEEYLADGEGGRRETQLDFTRNGNDVTITDRNNGDGNGNYQGVTVKNFNKIGNRSDLYVNGDILTSFYESDGNIRYELGGTRYGTQEDDVFAYSDSVEEYAGGAGNDTYNIGSANSKFDFTSDKVVITDTEGTNDVLNITSETEMKVLFDIQKTGSTVGKALYVVGTDDSTDLTYGIELSGVDSISANEKSVSSSIVTNEVISSVQSWLSSANSGGGYDSVADAIAANDNDIASLIKCYTATSTLDTTAA